MKLVYKVLVAIPVGLLVFYAAIAGQAQPDYIQAAIIGAAALLLSALTVFLDRIFRLNGETLFCISIGAFLGLIAGSYLQQIVSSFALNLSGLTQLVYLVPVVFFGYVGSLFARSPGLKIFGGGGHGMKDEENYGSTAKLLDTSVIIDGRILDIAETKFVSGPFIIPNFVLREIQLISDSADPIKRNRGRRGLEMLNKLQQRTDIVVKISYLDYTDTREVDAKLVKAAIETGAQLVTNDFNLNKVAELQGVEVLNLNSLTNALKPVVLPGEDILIDIIKEGKDENQGIGYLEDGTMVVVENGGQMQGKTVKVNVTSIIQTAAGKMIFTRAQGVVESDDDQGGGGSGGGQGEGGRRRRRRGGGGDRNRGGEDRGGDRNSERNDSDNGNRDASGDSSGDREQVGGGGGRRRR
ncbi:MAG: hypothetical protein NXI24_14385 [bacterium]|nr:hypothetical protein [bacterium]